MKTGLNINSRQTAGLPRLFLTMFVVVFLFFTHSFFVKEGDFLEYAKDGWREG